MRFICCRGTRVRHAVLEPSELHIIFILVAFLKLSYQLCVWSFKIGWLSILFMVWLSKVLFKFTLQLCQLAVVAGVALFAGATLLLTAARGRRARRRGMSDS